MIDAAAFALVAWALAVAVVSGVALARARRARSRGETSRGEQASKNAPRACRAVLVVRPCAGHEPHLARTLASVLHAHRDFPIFVRFVAHDAGDASLPVARRACRDLIAAGIEADLVIARRGERGRGADRPAVNRKALQLAAALEGDPHSVVVVADSDVDLAGIALGALVGALEPGVAAAWAPPVERGAAAGCADRASAAVLGGSLHAFPLLAGLDEGSMVGKLFVIRRGPLDEVGGFGALAGYLGEDVELARRLRARGHRVRPAPITAPSMACGRRAGEVIARYARWIAVVRAQRAGLMITYPALFFATPLIVALSITVAARAPAPALLAGSLAIGARLAVALGAARASGRPVGLASAALDAALADGVLALAFARAVWSRKVIWRSRALTIGRDGLLRGEHDRAGAGSRSGPSSRREAGGAVARPGSAGRSPHRLGERA
jgi:ceramide glucosyltransferase